MPTFIMLSQTPYKFICNIQFIMSDDQQGFAIEDPNELVQYNYQPSSRAWTTFTNKGYPHYKRSNQLTLIAECSKLINGSIYSEWLYNLIPAKNNSSIVYTNGNKIQPSYQEQNITFHSEFESGNLQVVSRIKNNEYQLYMKPDTNTKSHFQWFYFKVIVKKAKKNIKFTIKNFIKSTMLYSEGLKPYCRSLKNPEFHEFKQIQSPVKFYQQQTGYYSLQFCYHFEEDNEEVQFSSQPPYTFHHLNKFIDRLKCKKLTLNKTILGTKIPYLVFQSKKETKGIVIAIARQHPGQAVSSWVIEGFINMLTEKKMNETISWYIIPMVNIDGVVLGNNRTGVLGHDFNRNWVYEQPSNSKFHKLFPQIQGIIALVKNLKKKYPKKPKMFLDFHGHSSQPNVFIYGPPHEEDSQFFYPSRLFPQLISKKNSNFKLDQTSYILKPEKKRTARSVLFYNIGIPYIYTIESTFGVMNGKKVMVDDFVKVGEDIALSSSQFMHTLISKQTSPILQDLKTKYANIKNQGKQFDSASEESDENLNRKEIQQMVISDQVAAQLKNTVAVNANKANKRYHRSQSIDGQVKVKMIGKSSEGEKQSRDYSTAKKISGRRINTEVQLVMNKKQCIFPNISTRNSKLGFQQSLGIESNDEILRNFKMDDLQKRLHKLRNSKIGKKILVINAYCS